MCRAEAPRAGLPVITVLVEVQERLAFSPLEVDYVRRPKGHRAARIVGSAGGGGADVVIVSVPV